jgi:eukaryotic-like serine/threonine-protein kinase
VLGLAGLIEARAGNQKKSRELLDELDREYPLATFNLGVYSPMIRTTQAVSQGSSAAEVTSLMEPALPYELGTVANLLPIYVRGVSYLQVHSPAEAQREFQKIVDHRAVDAASTLYPLAELGLARSYTLLDTNAESRGAYESFFAQWKSADQDLPILRKAQREYRDLK